VACGDWSCLTDASCWANAPRWGGRLRCWHAAPLPLPQTWTCCAVQIVARVPLLLYLGPRLANVVSLRKRPNSILAFFFTKGKSRPRGQDPKGGGGGDIGGWLVCLIRPVGVGLLPLAGARLRVCACCRSLAKFRGRCLWSHRRSHRRFPDQREACARGRSPGARRHLEDMGGTGWPVAEQGAGSGPGRRPLPCQCGSVDIAPVWVS
jgi:hypothetical protein